MDEDHHLHLDDAEHNYLRILLETAMADAKKNLLAGDFNQLLKSKAVLTVSGTILDKLNSECDCI